jgi:antitoxin FitA
MPYITIRFGMLLQSLISMSTMKSLVTEGTMASMTIRGIDDRLKAKLRLRAAHHGHSMEEEAREILRTALSTPRPANGSLVDCIRARIEPLGGIELKIAPREPIREPVRLDK